MILQGQAGYAKLWCGFFRIKESVNPNTSPQNISFKWERPIFFFSKIQNLNIFKVFPFSFFKSIYSSPLLNHTPVDKGRFWTLSWTFFSPTGPCCFWIFLIKYIFLMEKIQNGKRLWGTEAQKLTVIWGSNRIKHFLIFFWRDWKCFNESLKWI